MDSANPYAPPRAHVSDVIDPSAPLVHADRGTRFAANLLDSLIFGVLVYTPLAVAFFSAVVDAGTNGSVDPVAFQSAFAAAGVAAMVGFTVWCVLTVRFLLRNSQSIAKKLLGIKVVRADGSHASLARIFWLRNVVNTLLSIVPFYFFVDALFIFGEPRQCLHDRLADTIVVKA